MIDETVMNDLILLAYRLDRCTGESYEHNTITIRRIPCKSHIQWRVMIGDYSGIPDQSLTQAVKNCKKAIQDELHAKIIEISALLEQIRSDENA